MQLGYATLRDLGGGEDQKKLALDVAADVIKARLENFEIRRPDPTT